jgi:hypothetical protein
MSVITFVDIRDAAINQIKAPFSENKKLFVAAHPGRFNEAEVKRLASQTPAILTSFMSYTDEDHTIHFVSWVLYRAGSKDLLYDGALKLVSALIPVIRNIDADWSIAGGRNVEAECLYSGSLDQINITLWGVKWDWEIRDTVFEGGQGGIPLDDLDYFEGYDAAHRIGSAAVKDIVHLEVSHANTDETNSGQPAGAGPVSGS